MKNSNVTYGDGNVTSAKGFQASGVFCGLKRKRKDVALLVTDRPASIVGMFTTNLVPAHCVIYNKQRVADGAARALIINAGNANCCTGEQGRQDNLEMAQHTAELLGVTAEDVLVLSTGVIGEPMPMDKIRRGIDMAVDALSTDGGEDAAHAIMTTDTTPKHFSAHFELDGVPCCIGVMAKGSGMIHPNLATMFAVFTTDVAIDRKLMQEAFQQAVEDSFNMMTVDGETSTNDSVLLFANGAAGNSRIDAKDEQYNLFASALKELAIKASQAIARDGEGATKLVTVAVSGAATKAEAIVAAKAIAKSMLVKTAIFGKDPNWGRVVQSAGASGAQINVDAFGVEFAGVTVAENGGAIPFDREKTIEIMKSNDIRIKIDLGVGDAAATVFTCDLTYDYVTINAEYHT